MKKNLLLVIILFFVFALNIFSIKTTALSNGEVEDKVERINKTENIVFVGDSIFDWYPIDKIFNDLPIVNSGIAGNKTTDILNDLENRIYRYNPTKVFIQIGTNDIEWDDSDELNEQVYQNIVSIAEGVRQNRSKSEVFIISIYPVNNNLPGANDRHISEIKAINNKLKSYCATSDGIVYIDAFKELTDENEMFDIAYTNDGLHPNHLGYAKLSEILIKYIY